MERTMIRVVYAADLFRRPLLAASMFRDRAAQFHDRLGWQVDVDDQGLEFDQYDAHNPLYVIAEDADGAHLGSGRLMPTTGPTMIADHFADLTGGVDVCSALIWESTRFCVSPRAGRNALRVSSALLWAGADIALRAGVEFYVGVFAAPMLRVYRSCGWSPEVLGARESPEGEICAGLWEVTAETRDRLAERARGDLTGAIRFFPSADRFPFDTTVSANGLIAANANARPLALAG
jgi:acyl homoserine lactone synthase